MCRSKNDARAFNMFPLFSANVAGLRVASSPASHEFTVRYRDIDKVQLNSFLNIALYVLSLMPSLISICPRLAQSVKL